VGEDVPSALANSMNAHQRHQAPHSLPLLRILTASTTSGVANRPAIGHQSEATPGTTAKCEALSIIKDCHSHLRCLPLCRLSHGVSMINGLIEPKYVCALQFRAAAEEERPRRQRGRHVAGWVAALRQRADPSHTVSSFPWELDCLSNEASGTARRRIVR
jgi:hypothetical protein